MSDPTIPKDGPRTLARVLKSHQVVGGGMVFPMLVEPPVQLPPVQMAIPQAAAGQLAPTGSPGAYAAYEAAQEVAAAVVPAAIARHDLLLEVARQAEERGRAVERRAAALLMEAEETAAARLKEVQAQCEHMLNRTSQAIEQIEAEARQAGHALGKEEGCQAGLADAAEAARARVSAAEEDADRILREARVVAKAQQAELAQRRDHWLEDCKEEVLQLAFVLARQILKTEVLLRPEAVLPMLQAAVAKLKGEEEPLLRVGTELLSLMEAHRGELLAATVGARRLCIEADGSLQPGDFVVQGSFGLVNGTLENQLKVLRTALDEGGSP